MFGILKERLRQKYRTNAFPAVEPVLSDRFRGCPSIDSLQCAKGCSACIDACPTKALSVGTGGAISFDLGKCLFCADCERACPSGAVSFSKDYRLSTRKRGDLLVDSGRELRLAQALEKRMLSLFGRSLKLRQVSAGGCNACEADTNVLNTLAFDLGRFGVQFVASPRHADGLLITGPVSRNMEAALIKTWNATPSPRIVIAVGACAISGGPFIDHDEVRNGADSLLPVDLFVPGCPPHPYTILDGLLRLLNRR